GARVIAVARGEDRLTTCRDRGADITVNSAETKDLRESLLSHGPLDIVYDCIGGADGLAAQRCLGPEGRHILIGFASGALPDLKPNHLMVKNLDIIGVNWSHYAKHNTDAARSTVEALLPMLGDGRIKPHIGATYSLADAAKALEHLRRRTVTGKIIVRP
ncbi:MAG: zinc-binding dehydrogenase, partial [Pseudomonadota bacterium]